MAWYFLRVPRCNTRESVEAFKREVAKLGRVYEHGLGTEVDSTAGWYTIQAKEPSVPDLRDRLHRLGISVYIDLVEPLIKPIDGRAIARQLALF